MLNGDAAKQHYEIADGLEQRLLDELKQKHLLPHRCAQRERMTAENDSLK